MKHKLLPSAVIGLATTMAAQTGSAQNLYIPGPVAQDAITQFEEPLQLTVTTPESNEGLSVQERRASLFAQDATVDASDDATHSDLSGLDGAGVGQVDGYLYRFTKDSDANDNVLKQTYTGNLALGTGTTGGASNLPLVLDLGETNLEVNGTLEMQGAVVVTTVNSDASSLGLRMNGTGSLGVDASRTGQIMTSQLIELGGGQANFKLMLDLNSTLENGTGFIFLSESRDQLVNEDTFTLTGNPSILFDTSYVINSSLETITDPNNPNRQQEVVSFERADNEYITKSFTDNHPSNDAALKLGTIAADGVALGDMQTALTHLDINDFGYGNNAENLAVQVKRLAPIANNSFLIAAFDGVSLTTDAIDYRIASRRGNWAGYSKLSHAFWLKGVAAHGQSSGSVPVATATAQDTAGHDGFQTQAHGLVMGYDKKFDATLLGMSYANVKTRIVQADDREGETSNLQQNVWSLYGQWHGRYHFLQATAKYANGEIAGARKAAVGRTADYAFDADNTELALKLGRRFDLSNGRSAITPYVRASRSRYQQLEYQETGAGDLSLHIGQRDIRRKSVEAGLSMSHKGRVNGIKALTVIDVSAGKDVSISDRTIYARYTGDTHTTHPDYTSFTTPAESWSAHYVNLRMDAQLELAKRMMLTWGVNAELRLRRQNYSTDLSLNWVF